MQLTFVKLILLTGILLGYVSNVAFHTLALDVGWRVMLGLGAVPAVIMAVGVLFMPESPRWLVLQGRLGEAKKVLDITSDTVEEAKFRLDEIKEAVGIALDCHDDVVTVNKDSHGEGVWRDLLLHPTPVVKHVLLCALGIHFLQQATGIDSVVLYSPEIFGQAGIHSDSDKLKATIGVGVTKTAFILVATFLLDRLGRRPLLLTSMGGMVCSLVGLAIGLTVIGNTESRIMWAIVLCVACVMFYVAFFSIGLGPIAWVYASEIFPLKLRAQGVSMAVAINRVTSGLISMTFISLYNAITIGGAFFLYASVGVLAWVFFYTLLPETQGKSLEEIESLFGTFFKWRSTARELKQGKGGDKNVQIC